ncbi:peptidoglycan transglycosylase, partial [Leisingera sp. ANG-M1]
LIAAVLPNPKERSARKPSDFVQRRARQIQDGAATIRADGRAGCFED